MDTSNTTKAYIPQQSYVFTKLLQCNTFGDESLCLPWKLYVYINSTNDSIYTQTAYCWVYKAALKPVDDETHYLLASSLVFDGCILITYYIKADFCDSFKQSVDTN